MKRKTKKWWIVGGVGVVLLVATGALMLPAKRYHFLSGSELQNVTLFTMGSDDWTTHLYASKVHFRDLITQLQSELKAQGYVEDRTLGFQGTFQRTFRNGDETVTISGFTEDLTYVNITTRRNVFDWLLDKLHRDKLPNL